MSTSERELSIIVVRILANKASGEASIQELIDEIPSHITLTADDKKPSLTRDGEQLWEQRVRNITSHKTTPTNFIYKGYLSQIPGGLKITDAGRKL